MLLIPLFKRPDTDAVACCLAYTEFLNKKGIKTKACLCGIIQKEAEFVLKRFNIKRIEKCKGIGLKNSKIILVDVSSPEGISPLINPDNVIEVIDHRKFNKINAFPNAKTQIELVGSCATLIAEKYKSEDIEIKKEHAGLLYSAIISNTINFKNNVTTKKDIEMAKWLNENLHLTEDYIREMFEHKSEIKDNLKEVFESDFSQYNEFSLGIAQLEIINTDEFVNTRLKEIKKALSDIKSERKLKHVFLSVIDVNEGFNVFVCIDKETEEVLAPLGLGFKDNIAKRTGIIMRKEIVPIILKKLSQRTQTF